MFTKTREVWAQSLIWSQSWVMKISGQIFILNDYQSDTYLWPILCHYICIDSATKNMLSYHNYGTTLLLKSQQTILHYYFHHLLLLYLLSTSFLRLFRDHKFFRSDFSGQPLNQREELLSIQLRELNMGSRMQTKKIALFYKHFH